MFVKLQTLLEFMIALCADKSDWLASRETCQNYKRRGLLVDLSSVPQIVVHASESPMTPFKNN